MLSNKNYQYMEMCKSLSIIFSTCAKKKYCAVLIDGLGHVVGIGYNGGPSGVQHCEDGGCPRYSEGSSSGSNYDNCIAIHAEANAFLHSDYNSRPVSLYVNGPPCFSCAKLISNSTVQNVYYISDESYADWSNVKDFLVKCGINLVEVV